MLTLFQQELRSYINGIATPETMKDWPKRESALEELNHARAGIERSAESLAQRHGPAPDENPARTIPRSMMETFISEGVTALFYSAFIVRDYLAHHEEGREIELTARLFEYSYVNAFKAQGYEVDYPLQQGYIPLKIERGNPVAVGVRHAINTEVRDAINTEARDDGNS